MSMARRLEPDPELTDRPEVRQAWDYLRERFGDVSLESRVDVDLDLDSMDWIELAVGIGERTGARIDDHGIARVGTLRDLLIEVARSAETGDGVPVAPLARPEDLLNETQRRYLDPLPPRLSLPARAMFALNRVLFRRVFGLRVLGLDNLPAEPPFVITPNHISYLDGLVVAAALPYSRLRDLRWVAFAGQSLANAVTRLASRLALIVPIDADESPLAGLAGGAAVLARGDILVWFPAGERSPDGNVQEFQPGIGVLAEHFRLPVVPTVIDGTRRAWPPGQKLPHPGKVTIEFGPALDPAELAREGSGDEEYTRITGGLRARIIQMIRARE